MAPGEALYDRYKDALKRGHVASLKGRLDEALDAYAEASRIAPERATPHTSAGTALLRRKRAADALRYFEAALTLAPRDETALVGRAQSLAALDRRREAAEAYDKLAEHRAGQREAGRRGRRLPAWPGARRGPRAAADPGAAHRAPPCVAARRRRPRGAREGDAGRSRAGRRRAPRRSGAPGSEDLTAAELAAIVGASRPGDDRRRRAASRRPGSWRPRARRPGAGRGRGARRPEAEPEAEAEPEPEAARARGRRTRARARARRDPARALDRPLPEGVRRRAGPPRRGRPRCGRPGRRRRAAAGPRRRLPARRARRRRHRRLLRRAVVRPRPRRAPPGPGQLYDDNGWAVLGKREAGPAGPAGDPRRGRRRRRPAGLREGRAGLNRRLARERPGAADRPGARW